MNIYEYCKIIDSKETQFLVERGCDKETSLYYIIVTFHILGDQYFVRKHFKSYEEWVIAYRKINYRACVKMYKAQLAQLN